MPGHRKVICIDFDGTCVDHRYPDVGPPVPGAVETLRDLAAAEFSLVLWTMRSAGDGLEEAIDWFERHSIPLFGVNRNPEQDSWTTSPKAYAQVYVDDAAFGAPLIEVAGFKRRCIDWGVVREHLLVRGDHRF